MTTRLAYPTDLTAAEWRILEPLAPAPNGRPADYPRRQIGNALPRSGAHRLCLAALAPRLAALAHRLPPPVRLVMGQSQIALLFYFVCGGFGALALLPSGMGLVKLGALVVMAILLGGILILISRRQFDRARQAPDPKA